MDLSERNRVGFLYYEELIIHLYYNNYEKVLEIHVLGTIMCGKCGTIH